MNPHIIKLLLKGHEEKIKEQDYIAWIQGQYTLAAVSVAVEHCLSGKKAKSKYMEKPLLQQAEEKNKPMSEEELQRKRELFVAKLQAVKANFDLVKKGGEIKAWEET